MNKGTLRFVTAQDSEHGDVKSFGLSFGQCLTHWTILSLYSDSVHLRGCFMCLCCVSLSPCGHLVSLCITVWSFICVFHVQQRNMLSNPSMCPYMSPVTGGFHTGKRPSHCRSCSKLILMMSLCPVDLHFCIM